MSKLLTLCAVYGLLGYASLGIKASLVVSAIKAISGSCNKEYFIEVPYVISGDWFCAEK